jgi:WD40 repeat protein
MDISSDNKYLVTGSNDNSITIWELAKFKLVKTIRTAATVKSVKFSSDSKSIIASICNSYSKSWVQSWDVETGKHTGIYATTLFSSGGKHVSYAMYAPNREQLIIAIGGSLQKWDPQLNSVAMAFSIGVKRSDVQAQMKSFEEKYNFVPYAPHSNQMFGFSQVISKDGNLLLTYTRYEAKVWQRATGKLIKTWSYLTFNLNHIGSACFHPDSKQILIAGHNMVKEKYKWTPCISFVDIQTGKVNREILTEISPSTIFISSDNKYLFVSGNDIDNSKHCFRVIDLGAGSTINEVKRSVSNRSSVAGNYLFKPSKNGATLEVGEEKEIYPANATLKPVNFPKELLFDLDNIWVFNGNEAISFLDKSVIKWDYVKGKVIDRIDDFCQDKIQAVSFADGHNKILFQGKVPDDKSAVLETSVYALDCNTLKTVKPNAGEIQNAKQIATPSKSIKFFINNSQAVHEIKFSEDLKFMKTHTESYSGKPKEKIISLIDFSVKPYNTTQGGIKWQTTIMSETKDEKIDFYFKLYHLPNMYAIRCVSAAPDKSIVALGKTDGKIEIFDYAEKVQKGTLLSHNLPVEAVYAVNKEIVVSISEGIIKVSNLKTGKWTGIVVATDTDDWVVFNSDGYWDGSISGGELVSMVDGLNVYSIDQFAVQNNRPDKIIENAPFYDEELAKHFLTQYKKRIRRAGLNESLMSDNLKLPISQIISSSLVGNALNMKLRFEDKNESLIRFQVFVNDVPVYGIQGKAISGNSFEIDESIELLNGDNKVEVSCINISGKESYRVARNITINKNIGKNLYFLAFGVSRYQNSTYNLAYADKDALDLSKVIETYKGKGFENVYTKVLTNEQVTPQAIKDAKDFVKNAKVDDTFILFIAGHGMHDRDAEATYYFLTSNADINNLKGTAADFETIEDLLQGIPPRNKLFLMDACESGEIDDEDQGQMLVAATGAGIASRGFKAVNQGTSDKAQGISGKRAYLYQKDRYIYNDLVRRSGAIVFSSSKGGELSYERSDIENGLFTEYIMKALTTSEADKDGNGTVSTDELREYVSSQVAKASGDLQHPTVDRDNIYQKFGFGVK